MNANPSIKQISVQQLKESLDKGQTPVILDVRESHELAIAQLPPTKRSVHIPLGQLEFRLSEIAESKQEQIVIYCRSGGRSMVACNTLMRHGFADVRNLSGGILAWAKEIDPQVRQY
jgi:adenylyltransferase/sulfurtransferase